MRKSAVLGLAAGLVLGVSSPCLADDLAAEQKFADTTVGFELKGSYSNVTLSIAGPNDFHATASSKSGAPSIDLRGFGAVEDGTYTYQLTAASDQKVRVRTQLDNGRDSRATAEPLKGVSTSGTFNVQGGTIVKRDPARESKRDQQDKRDQ